MNPTDYEAELEYQKEREYQRKRHHLSVEEMDAAEARAFGGEVGDRPDPEYPPDTFEVVCTDTSTLDRADWLNLRRQGLGSSDAAPMMGMSPWRSSYALWCEKRGLLADDEDSERFWWGRELEPLILRRGELEGWWKGGVQHWMVRSTERPWMLANPDLLTRDAVVEAKTASAFDERRWEEGVPDHYVIQGHWLMVMCGRDRCLFPVFFGDHLRLFDVAYDPEVAEAMIEAGERFWRRVVDNDPPDVDGSESTMQAVRAQYLEGKPEKTLELDGEHWADRLRTHRVNTTLAKAADRMADLVKAELMVAMGDAEIARLNGKTIATWRTGKSGRTFRWGKTDGE